MYRVSSSCTTASDCAAQLLTNRQSKIYFVKALSQRISHSTKHKFLILPLYYAVPFCDLIPESSLFDLLETCTFTKFLQIFMNFFPKIPQYLECIRYIISHEFPSFNVNLFHRD